MALKRKTRNLPTMNDQLSFFDPVYPNDEDNENDLLADGIPRPSFGKGSRNESNETLDTDTITNNDQDQSSELISTTKIIVRIKQIQNSIQQARTMLESMEEFKHLVPGTDEQRVKLHSIISNLEEQQASYVNLLNLITLTAEERSAILSRNSSDDEDNDDLSLRGNIHSPLRPRIESKIGFIPPSTRTTIPLTINSSDNEQTNRNDYSNYDSLVGSLKSDTITWKDQQSTSADEESDVEMEKNLMSQKEQLRALQGQKRALLALQRRSEQHLIEQQQLTSKKKTNLKQTNEENDLLSDIDNLRRRLTLLRNLYEQKHQVEIQQLQNSSKKSSIPTENRLKNLEHIRERLDELEQIVAYYQTDLNNQQEEEIIVYKGSSIQADEAQRLTALIQQANNDNNDPKQLDKLSSDLTAKRLELEQAKSALNQLQQMVKTIHPDENLSSACSTPISRKSPPKTHDLNNQYLYTPTSSQQTPKSPPKINNDTGTQMVAQHREIERLVESRQRLHTIKGQIASLHQNMTTPPIPLKQNLTDARKTYEDKLNDSRNIRPTYRSNRPDDNESDISDVEGEETDEDTDSHMQTNPQTQSRIKQSNLCVSNMIVGKSAEELSIQMREICRCLSAFIDEQKSFNRHIEQRLTTAINPSVSQSTDPMFNQLQQQVLAQGLIVNLNTAYREIAVLQSEINALQSENNRLTSSISFDNQYHHRIPHLYSRDNSKESIVNFDPMKPIIRPQPRSRFDEQLKQQNHILTTNHSFPNSSKTSVNSQSTGKRTAIRVEKINLETTPIKQERNGKFSTEYFSSPKQISNTYDHHRSSIENLSKSFIIRRRPITNENEPNPLHNYKQKLDQQHTFDVNDEEQQVNDMSTTVFNIQPSAYYTSATQDLDNVDIQTLDLQVKSIMVQLIPFMRLHINEIFNQSNLNHIRERTLFLFKQQPDSAQLIRHFQNQFSELLGKATEKYCGTTIRECAVDLIRDISDVAFEELVKYKIYENTTAEQNTLYEPSAGYYTQETSLFDDGENDNKYQIELSESENRPLTLIGSDEEDNDSDQEENKERELETAVSRQESHLHQHETPISTELHSNGHEYILINRSTPRNEEEE